MISFKNARHLGLKKDLFDWLNMVFSVVRSALKYIYVFHFNHPIFEFVALCPTLFILFTYKIWVFLFLGLKSKHLTYPISIIEVPGVYLYELTPDVQSSSALKSVQ